MPSATIVDPLGRQITLHDHTWFGHILKGHPDMNGYRQEAERTVARPLEIQISTSDADCRVYYGQPSAKGIMVAVVADVVIGIVKTAYLTNKKKNGVIEW